MTNEDFTVVNSQDGSEKRFRVLVQTDKELPSPDLPVNSIKYTGDSIANAIDGLVGKMVYDNTNDGHSRKQGRKSKSRIFAQVDNAFYKDGKGYVDLDVFDDEYLPLMKQLQKSHSKGLKTNEGFSTTLKINDGYVTKDNRYVTKKYNYKGLDFVNSPRDADSSVVDLIVNSLPVEVDFMVEDGSNGGGNPQGGETVVPPVVQPTFVNPVGEDQMIINRSDYDLLMKNQKDLQKYLETEEGKKIEEAKQAFDEVNNSLDTANTDLEAANQKIKDLEAEKKALEEELKPVQEAMKINHETMVNSILEKLPEAEREAAKPHYSKMDYEGLEMINKTIANSIGDNTNNGLVDSTGGNPANTPDPDSKVGSSDYEKQHGINFADLYKAEEKKMSGE
jgi:hypothetical protein